MTVIEKFGIRDDDRKLGKPRRDLLRAASEFNLREYMRSLWRNRRILFGTVIVLTGLAAILIFQLTPRFRGEVLVMISPPQQRVVKIEQVLKGLPFSQDTINSEIAILQSRRLTSRLVDKAGLTKDPEFNPALSGNRGIVVWVKSQLGIEPEPLSAEDKKRREREAVITKVRKSLKVTPLYRSRVLRITVSSVDPKKAARLSNMLADLYLVDQLEAKFDATKRASNWLSGRIAELRRAVAESERKVAAFRAQRGLFKGQGDQAAKNAQIDRLNNQLILARAKRAEAQAQLERIQALIKSRRGVASAAGVLSSPLIQRLREKETTVLARKAELGASLGAKHPRMIAVNQELWDIRRKITDEVRKIVENIRGNVRVAEAREASLLRSLAEAERDVAKLNKSSVQLRALEREAKANRLVLETILQRFKETTSQEGLQTPDARIIARAVIPNGPYFPNKPLFVLLAFAGSLVIGLAIITLIEQLDSGFRSGDQIESVTGMPTLGIVPEVASKHLKDGTIKGFLDRNPVSAFAEAMRSIQVSLALSDVDRPPKTVLITSTSPEEGKSATAFSLARVAAEAGRSVVIIDCDLRRPQQHAIAGIKKRPGLVELLAEKATLDRVMVTDRKSGLKMIPAGEAAPNPTDILGSEHMRRLLEKLSKEHDLVILDCSPVMAVTDARVLGSIADCVLFCVRWAKTRRENAIYAVKQMTDAGAKLAGFALTRVDVKRHAGYGYGDSGSYHGRYTKYYAS